MPHEKNEDLTKTEMERKPLLLKCGRALAVLALAGTLFGGLSEAYTGDSLYVPRSAAQYAESYTERTDTAAMQEVELALSNPDNSQLLEIGSQSGTEADTWEERYADLYKEKASEYNIEIIDSKEYESAIDKATTIEELVKIENDFLANYGVTFTLSESESIKDIGFGFEPFDAKQDSLEEMKTFCSKIVGSLSYMPVEVVKLSKFKEIIVVGGLDALDKQASGQANIFTNRVYINQNILEYFDFTLICHEIAHGVDVSTQGPLSYLHDPEYEGLNSPGFQYGQSSEYKLNGDVCSPYAMKVVGEDKADMMESMINGLDSDKVYTQNPVIKSKYRLLLARLEERVPGITRFFASTSLDKSLTSWEARDMSEEEYYKYLETDQAKEDAYYFQ